MEFGKADLAEISEIVGIVLRAKERMRRAGSLQWQRGYPARADIAADLRCGNGYVLRGEGGILAYGALLFSGEPAYAALRGKWLSEGAYAVLHRLAVADGVTGRGIASEFLRRAEEEALSRGTGSFRVDTNFDNAAMLRVLAKRGFVRCGEVAYREGTRIAFEKLL